MVIKYDEYKAKKVQRYIDSIKYDLRCFPPSLQVGLTNHCLNKCLTCGHWKRQSKNILDIETLLNFLRDGNKAGLETVCYSGGDPFIYPPLNDLMRWHITNEIDYGFITAGYVPTHIDLDLLRRAKFIRVSLDALDDVVYKKVRGGAITASQVIASIGYLMRSHGFENIGLGVTVHKHNWMQVGKIVRYAFQQDIKELRIWLVRNVPGLELDRLQSRALKGILEEYEQEGLLDSIGLKTNFDLAISILDGKSEVVPFEKCYASLLQWFVMPNGDVYPCCIMAGDSEEGSYCDPLFNMVDQKYERFDYGNAINWCQHSQNYLPTKCTTGCIRRLSSVNSTVGKELSRKEFI